MGHDGLYQFPALQSLVPRTSQSLSTSDSVVPIVDTASCKSVVSIVNTAACISSSFSTWHSRLGHPSVDAMRILFKLCNIPPINKTVSDFCNHCRVVLASLTNFHRLPLNQSIQNLLNLYLLICGALPIFLLPQVLSITLLLLRPFT